MRELNDLLSSDEGREFLEAKGCFVRPDRFLRELRPPARPGLGPLLGCPSTARLVCVGQQVYADYRPSVVSKVSALRALADEGEVFPFLMWADTDRCGSDKLMTQIPWAVGGKPKPVRLVARVAEEVELRFVRLDPDYLNEALGKLEMYFIQGVRGQKWVAQARGKFQELRAAVLGGEVRTLCDFNRRLSQFLFARQLQFDPPSVLDSDILNQGLLTGPVNACLNALGRFIAVFNESVESLTRAGVNPQVRPLADDYLPLYYSCDADGARLRLRHTVVGADHFATAACACGAEYRFPLGGGPLSVDELARTNRWSPDLTVSLLLNDLLSGVVAGKSSAMYGLVLNEVLARVLGGRPIPVLVPAELGAVPPDPEQQTLLYRYLTS